MKTDEIYRFIGYAVVVVFLDIFIAFFNIIIAFFNVLIAFLTSL